MKKYVLDANTLPDLVEAGPGFQKAEHLFQTAIEQHSSIVISVLNWGEVFYLLWQRRDGPRHACRASRLRSSPLTLLRL
jgi:hypothetical protein